MVRSCLKAAADQESHLEFPRSSNRQSIGDFELDLFQSILDSCDAPLQVHAGGEYTFKLTDLASEVDLKWGVYV